MVVDLCVVVAALCFQCLTGLLVLQQKLHNKRISDNSEDDSDRVVKGQYQSESQL